VKVQQIYLQVMALLWDYSSLRKQHLCCPCRAPKRGAACAQGLGLQQVRGACST